MSDPRLHDTHSDAAAPSAEDSRAQIEGLLLAGLDHYFAARYDQAIHVWTRVLFVDRGHARARAYIERARRAQAERQRESEALLHDGVDAFQRGDTNAARQLLTSAVERGAPDDAALAMLGRLDRLEAPATGSNPVEPSARRRPGPRQTSGRRGSEGPGAVRRWGPLAVTLGGLLIVVAVVVALNAQPIADWLLFEQTERAAAFAGTEEAPLPVPSAAEAALTRARTLFERGRLGRDGARGPDSPLLREALRALDVIRAGDPLRAEADVLRAAIQQELLSTVETGPGVAAGPPQ